MNEPMNELISDLASFEAAMRAEGLGAAATMLSRYVNKFQKGAAAIGDAPGIDWGKVADRLETRAGKMHEENAALTTTARNTPYGVMTGTGTIILSMLAEAIGVGIGRPTQDKIDEALAALRQDRSAHIMAKITGKPGAADGVTKG